MKWRRVAGWTIGVIAAVILIAAVGGYFYLKSTGFRQFAMRKIIEQTNEATGGRSQIAAFDFELSTLTAHLYGVVLHGSEPAGAPPLLAVDKLTVGLKLQSVIHRRVTLSELLIEHPVAHLQVSRQGVSNVPQPGPSQSSSHTSVFDLAVGHAAIHNGEVNYNDRKTPVDAELHNLRTDVVFEQLLRRYRGSLSYDNGQLHYGEYAPMAHSFSANFSATPSAFSLESALLKLASSSVALRAEVTDYNNPKVSGNYDIHIHTQDFAAMAPSVKAAGDVAMTGKLRYQTKSGQSFLRSVAIDGQIESDGLSAMASGSHFEVRKVRGNYQLVDGDLRANRLAADLLGGSTLTDLEMRDLDSTPTARVRTVLHNLSLQTAQRGLPKSELNRVAIVGNVDGTAEAYWTGRLSNVRAKSDLTIRSGKEGATPVGRDIPVDGVIHAAYDAPKNTLTVHQTTLRIPSTRLTADGQVSKNSSLQLQAAANDLHGLVTLLSAFRSGPESIPAISGSANLNATVRGSLDKPQISGQVNAQNLNVEGSEWKSADLSLTADPSRFVISKADLLSAQRGRASLSGTIGLRDWTYLPSNPIQAHISVSQMSLADLQRLAKVQYPVSGELTANIAVEGSQVDPRGSGSLKITNGRAYDEPLQNFDLSFRGQSGSVTTILNVATNAGSATTKLTYTPRTKAYKLSLDAPRIVLEKVHAVQAKNLAMNGTLSISASGEGRLDDPQLDATVQLPRLDVRQKTITDVKAEVHLAHQGVDLTLNSEVAQASVRARGHVNLTGDYETDASIDTAPLPLDVLLATYASVPQGFQGQTEVHLNLKGPLKDKSRIEAHLTIPTLKASYQSFEIGAAAPIRADYSGSVLTLQPAEIRGTGTSLRVQGRIPFAGNATPTLTAQGTIDAQILRIAVPDVQSSGTVALDLRTSGSSSGPQIQGQVRLQNIAVTTTSAPLGVQKLNGAIEVTNDRLQISNVTAEVAGGQVAVGGSVTYRPSPQFNIAVQGKSVRLRYPDGLRTVLDSNLAWSGDLHASSLNGRVLIGALSFTPDFDLASFGDQFSSNAATPAQPGFADTVNLQIAVQSKGNLSATTSQVSLEGDANLRVTGTAANPIVTGRTDLNAGELFYRNVRYQLERGIITFDDPNQTHPVLNVSVSTVVQQYNLTVNLRGPFDALTISYSSDPPIASADIINLIARGKTSSELAASSPSTDSMIASQAAGRVSGSLQKLAGFSSLQIDPLLGGNNQNPSARISLQQRVTKNFLFTFSTDVSEPGSELVQGDYQVTPRWSVSVARDQLGGVSVDGRFHTKF